MSKNNEYYIRGQNGEYVTLQKDVDDEYSFFTSTKFEDAEIMDRKFAEYVLADLNEDGENYFRICKVEKEKAGTNVEK